MLKFIHKNKKSVLLLFVVAAVCLMMTGFGLGFLADRGGGSERYAIKVGETEIGYSELARQRRELQETLRMRFGNNYWRIIQSLNMNLNQKIAEEAINKELVTREARRLNLEVGDQELSTSIQAVLQGAMGDFSKDKYRAFLAQIGESARGFEERMRRDLLIGEIETLVQHASFPARREVRSLAQREETKYDAAYLEFAPKAFEGQVPALSEEQLQQYYNEHATEYEQPARISYEYILFDPDKFQAAVEVQPEDIELYYTDNLSRFKEPQQVKARHVLLLFPEKADEARKAEVKQRAEEVHGKAVAGESFESLAQQYSEDFKSKMRGGDLGWIAPGLMSKQFDEAVFKLQGPGVAEIIKNDNGYEIVKVEEYKEPQDTPLDKVRAAIEQELRKNLAPAYARDKAERLRDQMAKSPEQAQAIASGAGLTIESSGGLLDGKQDPADAGGLTEKVLESPKDTIQIVDLGEKTALVIVKEHKEAAIPAFAELGDLKDKVRSDMISGEARRRAEAAARETLAGLQDGKPASLAAAQAAGRELKEKKDISRAAAGDGVLARPEVQRKIFALSPSQVPSPVLGPFEAAGSYYLVQVTAVRAPAEKDIEEKIAQYEELQGRTAGRIALAALQNKLKASTEIDVQPGVMASDGGEE